MKNLCDTCIYQQPECMPEAIIYGIDVDPFTAYTPEADCVVKCTQYEEVTE